MGTDHAWHTHWGTTKGSFGTCMLSTIANTVVILITLLTMVQKKVCFALSLWFSTGLSLDNVHQKLFEYVQSHSHRAQEFRPTWATAITTSTIITVTITVHHHYHQALSPSPSPLSPLYQSPHHHHLPYHHHQVQMKKNSLNGSRSENAFYTLDWKKLDRCVKRIKRIFHEIDCLFSAHHCFWQQHHTCVIWWTLTTTKY